MYGGPKIALSLTFVLDAGVEKDFCTLFKSDLEDVQHRPAEESDSTVVWTCVQHFSRKLKPEMWLMHGRMMKLVHCR